MVPSVSHFLFFPFSYLCSLVFTWLKKFTLVFATVQDAGFPFSRNHHAEKTSHLKPTFLIVIPHAKRITEVEDPTLRYSTLNNLPQRQSAGRSYPKYLLPVVSEFCFIWFSVCIPKPHCLFVGRDFACCLTDSAAVFLFDEINLWAFHCDVEVKFTKNTKWQLFLPGKYKLCFGVLQRPLP